MCYTAYDFGRDWINRQINHGRVAVATTANGCRVSLTTEPGTERIRALVYRSNDPKYPVGTVVFYQNAMGHVLCGGNDADHQDECNLHQLDMRDDSHDWWNKHRDGDTSLPLTSFGKDIEAAESSHRELMAIEQAKRTEHHEALDALHHEVGGGSYR